MGHIVTPNLKARSTKLHFTLDDMNRCAREAYGEVGSMAVFHWEVFNRVFFKGELLPIPLIITNTLPFGNRIAFCSHGSFGRTITLNLPKDHNVLVADNATLLHEMIHQSLFEHGENPKHDSEGWRREIMRLSKEIAKTDIWAGKSITRRIDGKVTRVNKERDDGMKSLTQGQIARWPHSVGIELGKLITMKEQSSSMPKHLADCYSIYKGE